METAPDLWHLGQLAWDTCPRTVSAEHARGTKERCLDCPMQMLDTVLAVVGSYLAQARQTLDLKPTQRQRTCPMVRMQWYQRLLGNSSPICILARASAEHQSSGGSIDEGQR